MFDSPFRFFLLFNSPKKICKTLVNPPIDPNSSKLLYLYTSPFTCGLTLYKLNHTRTMSTFYGKINSALKMDENSELNDMLLTHKETIKQFDMKHPKSEYIYQRYLGGGDPTSVEILSKFSNICRNTFSPKTGIFSKFLRCIYIQHPKHHFLLHFH